MGGKNPVKQARCQKKGPAAVVEMETALKADDMSRIIRGFSWPTKHSVRTGLFLHIELPYPRVHGSRTWPVTQDRRLFCLAACLL